MNKYFAIFNFITSIYNFCVTTYLVLFLEEIIKKSTKEKREKLFYLIIKYYAFAVIFISLNIQITLIWFNFISFIILFPIVCYELNL